MKFVLKSCFALCILALLTGCHMKATPTEKEDDLGMDGMEQAMRQEFRMTMDPKLNRIPKERLEEAKQAALAMARFRMTALTWQERGPDNIGGRTRAIMVDKRDATGNTVFAASVSGGIFKTTNFLGGIPAWSPVDDKMQNLAVTALIQDNSNPNIMYAGTGEGWFNIDAVRGAGIFKTTDGGTTWARIASTANFEYVQDVLLDKSGNLYASLRNSTNAGARGVQRSTDGGTTWIQVLGMPLPGFPTGRAADLELASNGDVYATLSVLSSRTQVWKSAGTNGANTGGLSTWTDVTPVHTTPTQRGEIAIAPSNPLRLYLLLQDSATSEVKTIYRSSDGASNWDSLPAPASLSNGTNSQAWYNLIAAIDPNNPDVFVAGALHVVRSTDAGATFTDLTPSTSGVHVDQHALVYLSSSGLIVGNDGGIYYSANANAATPTFTNKNNGFNVTQFYGADYHPTDPDYFLAGAQDNNTQKFTGPGINSTAPVLGGDGGVPHIDQTDGQIQIAATTANNFYRSLNNGASFSLVSGSNSRGQFINPSDYDDNINTLYSGDDPGQYFYINNLQGTVSSGTAPLTQIGSNREVTAVKVDPFAATTIWIGASTKSDATVASIPVVMKVTNANTSTPAVLASANIGTAATTNGAYLSSIDVDPTNANHILATLSNFGVPSVYESKDGGVTWTNIEGNLPDMPVYWGVFAPANAQLNGPTGGNGGVLLGTDLGVWTTSQINASGTVWIQNSGGFPNVRTDMIKIRPSDYLVVAATHGRGLFTTILPSVATGVPPVDNTRNFIKYTTVNRQQLYIKTGNLNLAQIRIRIYDMKGRLLRSADTRYEDQTIPVASMPAGSYILKVYGNKNEQYTWHFIK